MDEIIDDFYNLILPQKCVNCSAEGQAICDKCLKTIKNLKLYYCPVCKTSLPQPGFCIKCQDKSYLNGLYAVCDFNDMLVKKIIEKYKYNFITELEKGINYLIDNYFIDLSSDSIFIPIPLHQKRYLSRGFNQAEVIASMLKGEIRTDILKRIKNNKPQAKLSGKSRRENIKGIFEVISDFNLNNKTIVLVDDVYTTGSTIQECARVLKESGVNQVFGFVLAIKF